MQMADLASWHFGACYIVTYCILSCRGNVVTDEQKRYSRSLSRTL